MSCPARRRGLGPEGSANTPVTSGRTGGGYFSAESMALIDAVIEQQEMSPALLMAS